MGLVFSLLALLSASLPSAKRDVRKLQQKETSSVHYKHQTLNKTLIKRSQCHHRISFHYSSMTIFREHTIPTNRDSLSKHRSGDLAAIEKNADFFKAAEQKDRKTKSLIPKNAKGKCKLPTGWLCYECSCNRPTGTERGRGFHRPAVDTLPSFLPTCQDGDYQSGKDGHQLPRERQKTQKTKW